MSKHAFMRILEEQHVSRLFEEEPITVYFQNRVTKTRDGGIRVHLAQIKGNYLYVHIDRTFYGVTKGKAIKLAQEVLDEKGMGAVKIVKEADAIITATFA